MIKRVSELQVGDRFLYGTRIVRVNKILYRQRRDQVRMYVTDGGQPFVMGLFADREVEVQDGDGCGRQLER